ncbi:MAG: hypothetical protein IJK60_11120 [Clostridia bacterium]|nr:hypothetical protein [Clostridia bacterium]
MMNYPDNFGNRLTETSRFAPRKNLMSTPGVVFALLFICLATDFANFFQLFRSKFSSSYIIIGVLCVAFLLVYDALPILLGNQFSRRCVGLKTNDLLMIILFAFIGLCVVINFVLRIQTKDDLIPAEIFTLSGESTVNSDPVALTMAILLALASIITSAFSFYLSYCLNSERLLSEELQACESEKKRIESEICKLKMILSELDSETPAAFAERYDAQDYRSFKLQTYLSIQKILSANDFFKELLREYLGTPESYNYVSQGDNQRLLEMIREVASDIGLNDINELDLLCDTNPGKSFNTNDNNEVD